MWRPKRACLIRSSDLSGKEMGLIFELEREELGMSGGPRA